MGCVCSDHNLGELEQLNFDMQTHYYALRLLLDVPDEDRTFLHSRLLYERVSVMSDTVMGFKVFERCIREGCDMNAELPTTEQSEEAPLLNDELPEGI